MGGGAMMTDRRFRIEKAAVVLLASAGIVLAFQEELKAIWWFVFQAVGMTR